MAKQGYPSDLTDVQWALIEHEFAAPMTMGRPWAHDRREIVNAILYQSRTAVHEWYVRWREDCTWDVHEILRVAARSQSGHDPAVGAAVLDAQSIPKAGPAEEVGYDAGKTIRGRKRHILVDSLGLLIAVLVTSAYVSDIAGGHRLLRRARLTNSMLGIIRCDAGYQGLDNRSSVTTTRIRRQNS